jgi:hypothetical protein
MKLFSQEVLDTSHLNGWILIHAINPDSGLWIGCFFNPVQLDIQAEVLFWGFGAV